MRIIITVLAIFLLSTPACLAATKYVEVMVDTSASMNEQIEGRAKLDIAKEAVSSVLSEIPDDIALGLRMYGNAGDMDVCKATKLLVSIDRGTKSEISKLVNDFSTGSLTPIAYSLKQAADDFPRGGENYIILVSDGKETCGGDPIATIADLKRQGYKIIVHTVGFDVDEDTRAQLKAIASASGGLYMDAKNAGELGASLKTITEKIREYMPYKEEGAVEPGQGFTSATEVELDKEYGKDIMVGEEHFYAVPVKKGQEVIVTVTMRRKEKGATWDASEAKTWLVYTAGILNEKEVKNNPDLVKYYGDPSAFAYTVSLYDPDRFILDGGADKNIIINWDKTAPDSVRISGKMPFSGKAYLAIGLNWQYPTSPKFCGDKKYQWEGKDLDIKFDEIRNKLNPSAYYTFKFRPVE